MVKSTILKEISLDNLTVFSAEEVASINNGRWILIHAYIVKNWVELPFFVLL